MTTKELIEKLNDLDFVSEVIDEADYIDVIDLFDNIIGFVNKEITYRMSTNYWAFDCLEKIEKQQLFDVFSKYASMPIKDREEKTLYTAISKIDSTRSLFRDVYGRYRILFTELYESDEIITEFTEEELKNVNGTDIWNSGEWLIEKNE